MSDWELYKDTDQFDSLYQEKLGELPGIIYRISGNEEI